MRIFSWSAGCTFLLLIGMATPAAGQDTILFDGGSPDGSTGIRVSDIGFFVAAADFLTTDAWEPTGAEFWSTEFPGSFQWDGTVKFYIFEDAGTPFGPPIFSGDAVSIEKLRDTSADCCGAEGYKYSFDFDTPVSLQANTTYWLGLTLGGGGTVSTTQAFWASTATTFQQFGAASGDPTFGSAWRIFFNLELAFRLVSRAEVLTVLIDIKPGSEENTINLSSSGVFPVAILSSEEFDATSVDPESIFMQSAAVRLAGQSDSFLCQVRDANNDIFVDLVCDVEIATFVDPGDAVAELVGETFDGQPINGHDLIRIVP